MRMRGLEPPRGCPHWHLKPARLPIPPHPLRMLPHPTAPRLPLRHRRDRVGRGRGCPDSFASKPRPGRHPTTTPPEGKGPPAQAKHEENAARSTTPRPFRDRARSAHAAPGRTAQTPAVASAGAMPQPVSATANATVPPYEQTDTSMLPWGSVKRMALSMSSRRSASSSTTLIVVAAFIASTLAAPSRITSYT